MERSFIINTFVLAIRISPGNLQRNYGLKTNLDQWLHREMIKMSITAIPLPVHGAPPITTPTAGIRIPGDPTTTITMHRVVRLDPDGEIAIIPITTMEEVAVYGVIRLRIREITTIPAQVSTGDRPPTIRTTTTIPIPRGILEELRRITLEIITTTTSRVVDSRGEIRELPIQEIITREPATERVYGDQRLRITPLETTTTTMDQVVRVHGPGDRTIVIQRVHSEVVPLETTIRITTPRVVGSRGEIQGVPLRITTTATTVDRRVCGVIPRPIIPRTIRGITTPVQGDFRGEIREIPIQDPIPITTITVRVDSRGGIRETAPRPPTTAITITVTITMAVRVDFRGEILETATTTVLPLRIIIIITAVLVDSRGARQVPITPLRITTTTTMGPVVAFHGVTPHRETTTIPLPIRITIIPDQAGYRGVLGVTTTTTIPIRITIIIRAITTMQHRVRGILEVQAEGTIMEMLKITILEALQPINNRTVCLWARTMLIRTKWISIRNSVK